MNYKEEIQEHLDYYQDGYKLKTNDEIIKIICEFGCGETEFHTTDIERLIKERQYLYDMFKESILILSNTPNMDRNDLAFIEKSKKVIELYK